MQRTLVSTIVLFTAAALSGCGSTSNAKSNPVPVAQCSEGDTKPAEDGCNTCSCDENGNWGCTEMGCVEEPVAEQCSEGDTKPAEDGCNTCSCDENGNWGCTEMGCPEA
jgi:hypothetical protein